MAQQQLNLPYVSPALYQMGRIAVTQRMHCRVDPEFSDNLVIAFMHGLPGQHLSSSSQKERILAVPVFCRLPGLPCALRPQQGAHGCQVLIQCLTGNLADKDNSLLAPLSEDNERVLAAVVGAQLQADGLASPEPAGLDQRTDHIVPEDTQIISAEFLQLGKNGINLIN